MTVYALLVGIDKYANPGIRSLNGCVKDVEGFREFLKARVIPEGTQFVRDNEEGLEDAAGHLKLKLLCNEQATRVNIIAGFRKHLKQAGNNDVALFYYSGHGSQELAPQEFWEVEPDKLNETLVCHDSRTPGQADAWDLADKELAQLIAEISQDKPKLHTVVILDACHSGSGTRDADDEGVRLTPTDKRERPRDSYLDGGVGSVATNGNDVANWYTPPEGKHLLLAACRPEEVARERFLDNETHGVLSYHLFKALTGAGPQLTYRDLFKHVNAMVRNMVKDQSPQIEASQESLDQPFLGGAVKEKKHTYNAHWDPEVKDWTIDGGSIHGIPASVGQETTRLALFPTLNPAEPIDLATAKGRAEVTQVFPNKSKIKGSFDGQPLDKNMSYKVVVTALPLPRLLVHMAGDEAALAQIQPALQPSLLVKAAETAAESQAATVRLTALKGEQVYRISRATDPNSLVVDTSYSEEDAAILTVQRLEHIARWLQTYELTNTQTRLADDAVALKVYLVDAQDQETLFDGADELVLRYSYVDDQWKKPRLKFRLVNNTSQTLYCGLLNLTPSYRVWPVASQDSGNVMKLPPRSDAWVIGGKRISMSIPDDLWKNGVTELHDLFKLIISTAEFDASLLEQEKLPVHKDELKGESSTRGGEHQNTLSRLMKRVQTRDADVEDEGLAFADWQTLDLSVTTIRPQEAVEVEANKTVELGEGVVLKNESALRAKARLMTNPEASRDLGNLALPAWLREDPAVSQPFELVSTRSAGQPSLSVLELAEVENYEAVTPAQPLKLEVGVPLKDNEQVIPLGFDGEFFLPLGWVTGRNGGVEITLERLPAPEPTKGLVGSLRIFFQKVVSEKLGFEFKYPLLSMVSYEADKDEVVYNDNLDAVKAQVAQASRILLYIHGIIGETKYMVPSAWREVDGRRLVDQYDLVLAFDYENLNTGIERTGESLRDKLQEVGLRPGHGKTFHLIAHSMGGLISRSMIELKDGHEIVQHLFMLGTPNGGSPWPNIQDWVTAALAIGVNSLASVAWPVTVVSSLLGAFERIDKNLDEMASGSDLLKKLANSPDPGVPYTIIAGNTSIIEAATQPDPTNPDSSRIQRLLSRLSDSILHGAGDLAFFKAPNDIVVSVVSIQNVLDTRSPQPRKSEVACDHITHFNTEVGVRALAEAVAAAQQAT